MSLTPDQRWLIALDIDGTLVHDDGYLSPRVAEEVKRVQDLGHLVVVATGRSAVNAIGVTKEIGLLDGKLIASNGAVTVKIRPEHPKGFETEEVITFDPTEVLTKLIKSLPDAHFAVEDAEPVTGFGDSVLEIGWQNQSSLVGLIKNQDGFQSSATVMIGGPVTIGQRTISGVMAVNTGNGTQYYLNSNGGLFLSNSFGWNYLRSDVVGLRMAGQ